MGNYICSQLLRGYRVLKPQGLNLYTVRSTGDPHYRTGIHRGEDMWEIGGFIVHFFSKEKVEESLIPRQSPDLRTHLTQGLKGGIKILWLSAVNISLALC